jgi:type II secretory pathway component PulF
MDTHAVNRFLAVYSWFLLAFLLLILLFIARFYQKITGENTRYLLFVVPMVLFAAASMYYASKSRVMGLATGDILLFAGGISLASLCLTLYRTMTAGRKGG